MERKKRYAILAYSKELDLYLGAVETGGLYSKSKDRILTYYISRLFLKQEGYRILKNEVLDYLKKESIKFAEQCSKEYKTKFEPILTRLNSKKCPIKIDWKYKDSNNKNIKPFTVKSK